MRRLTFLTLAAVIALLVAPSDASATVKPPEEGVALGPSVAWVSGADDTPGGVMLGVDLAYFLGYFWVSAGTRLRLESDAVGAVYPYVEAGGWLLLNLGVGYSLGISNDRSPWSNAHLFVGVPIPVPSEGKSLVPFVEPYYRPMLGDGVVVHEVGVLFKGLML